MIEVIKKNGRDAERFNSDKIITAVKSAQQQISDTDPAIATLVASQVKNLLDSEELVSIPVTVIHEHVENALMDYKKYDLARAYITYRKDHMPDIFRPRKEYRPYEYPHMIEYIDAIHQSFWTHKSFNLDSSVQDIKVNMPNHHASAVIRSILSVASVEAKVKSFWAKIGDKFPKSEFEELGATIGSNEVYHAHFYAKVLEQLNLNELFSEVLETPAMKNRISYMTKALKNKESSDKEYIKALIFFSLFIENVSLFSQFLTISVFNKELNQVAGLAQGISATALEENLHAQVGADIVHIVRAEHPEWFDEDFEQEILSMVSHAYFAEQDIIDWIFAEGELDFLPKDTVLFYMQSRINKGLEMSGFPTLFTDVDEKTLEQIEWFEIQTKTTIHRDFFSGHSINYNKNSDSFSEDDLF